ncbi:MAG TPA: HisA/HisF-related TIM barrel protein [Sphingopyxis sp.]|nr:HisA/HisF-related TIM barrel protein [Sphingopyxis sp.]HMP44168.1 HisA/HisF-related TIM barrel protein [Sphingopyxis sp.]HMQ18342.1 HisA/HisF-related TIM barrel protein [Sphingopyxis sp.]
MRRVRVIPVLTIDRDRRLVKTVRFGKRTYIGDPINAVRIFNTKMVDELLLLDIDATVDGRAPPFEAIGDIVEEAFLPMGYGGGIRSVEDAAALFALGLEKVVLSSEALTRPALVTEIAERFGAQAVAVALPHAKKLLGGQQVLTRSGKDKTGLSPVEAAKAMAAAGAGEIILTSIDRDGKWSGYDLATIADVAGAVDVPVVACGGASGLDDFLPAIQNGGASAVAASSLFVYRASGQGVLISYPDEGDLRDHLFQQLD